MILYVWKTQQLGIKTFEHLYMVFITLIIVIIIGISIGIFLYKYKRQNLSNIILNFLNAIESVPELALLVILIPLFGIGVKPTLVASVLYSILPIARNTYVGLTNVSNILKLPEP